MISYWKQVRENYISDANRDLNLGKITPEDYLNRMTSEFNDFIKRLDDCCVAPLDYDEIDVEPAVTPSNDVSRLCQLCANNGAVVALGCGCQQLCVTCFKEIAMTYTANGRREMTANGDPIVNAENTMKCPHCTVQVSQYIITRR